MSTTACLGLGALGVGCSAPPAALRVGAIVFPGYEFLFLAEQMGWLNEAPVHLVEMQTNTDTLRALALGRLEAAALTLDEALTGLSEGIPLRVVAVLDVSAGADVVLARPPAHDAADLRGRRVGVEDSAVGALMLAAVLEAAGLGVGDIQKVPMALSSSVEAYRSRQVDALVTAEPWASTLRAEGAQAVFDSRAIPGRIVDVLAVRADALPARAPGLTQLLRGHFRALAHFRAQPVAASALLAPRLQIPAEAVPGAFQGLDLPDLKANRALLAPNGSVRQGLGSLVPLLQAQGLMAREVDTGPFLDPRWLQGL